MGIVADANAELALGSSGAACLLAERAVLGCLLIDSGLYRRELDRVALRVSHFAVPAHRLVYFAMLEREARGGAFDLVTIANDLERTGKLHEAGGAVYLASLTDNVPDVEQVAAYARCVIDASVSRRMLALKEARR